VEKNFRRSLQGKFLRAPQAEQESLIRTFLAGRGIDLEVEVVHLVVLDRLLRAMTKKGKKVHPQTKY